MFALHYSRRISELLEYDTDRIDGDAVDEWVSYDISDADQLLHAGFRMGIAAAGTGKDVWYGTDGYENVVCVVADSEDEAVAKITKDTAVDNN